MDIKDIHLKIVSGIRDYMGLTGFKKAVIGLSGGIDSSLTLKLAVDALGKENVFGILMPELALTKRENVEHAEKLAKFLGVNTIKIPINRFLIEYTNLPWNVDEHANSVLANMNVKARVRANILYHFANSYKCLVFGTSNLSETLLGYGTKYGDLAADLEVIGALYKTQVRELATYLSLPQEIILKAPTAELVENQTDAGELGADYELLDKILINLEKGESGLIDLGFDPGIVRDVMHRVKVNKHKTVMPRVINMY